MCGELVDALRMKLAEAPGINTVLKPPTSGSIRRGPDRCCPSSNCFEAILEESFGRTWFVSFRKCRRRGSVAVAVDFTKGLYIARSSFSVRNYVQIRIKSCQIKPTAILSNKVDCSMNRQDSQQQLRSHFHETLIASAALLTRSVVGNRRFR